MFKGKNVQEQLILSNKTILNNFHDSISNKIVICDVLYGLVSFAQFKKRENLPWRSATVTFFTFFKLYKWYKLAHHVCLYRRQRKSDSVDYAKLKEIRTDTSNAVNCTKLKYNECLGKYLDNP